MFNMLPEELTLYIFSFLDLKSIPSACLVNTQFTSIMMTNDFWKLKAQTDFPQAFRMFNHQTNLNWHERYKQINKLPNKAQLLSYLELYTTYRGDEDSSSRRNMFTPIGIFSMQSKPTIIEQIQSIKELINASHTFEDWFHLIRHLRGVARTLNSESSKAALILHALASLIVSKLWKHPQWEFSIQELKDKLESELERQKKITQELNNEGRLFVLDKEGRKKQLELISLLAGYCQSDYMQMARDNYLLQYNTPTALDYRQYPEAQANIPLAYQTEFYRWHYDEYKHSTHMSVDDYLHEALITPMDLDEASPRLSK